MTNDWLVSFHAVITRVITGNTVMWDITAQHCRDCSKTLTLLETLETENRPREVFHVSSGVERSFTQVGCTRNKLQSHTDLLSLKLFLSMQVIAWSVYPLLISGIWFLKYHILLQLNPEHGATCVAICNLKNVSNTRTEKHSNTLEDLGLPNVDHVASNAKLSSLGALLYLFADSEAIIKMIIEGRNPTMRHVSRARRVALDW